MEQTTMREATIILPVADNDGRDLTAVHETFARRLCVSFGGFTADKVSGGWIGPGNRLYRDNSIRYTVAMEPCQTNIDTARILAADACAAARQECVYYRDPEGRVHFVKPEPLAPAPVLAMAA